MMVEFPSAFRASWCVWAGEIVIAAEARRQSHVIQLMSNVTRDGMAHQPDDQDRREQGINDRQHVGDKRSIESVRSRNARNGNVETDLYAHLESDGDHLIGKSPPHTTVGRVPDTPTSTFVRTE